MDCFEEELAEEKVGLNLHLNTKAPLVGPAALLRVPAADLGGLCKRYIGTRVP